MLHFLIAFIIVAVFYRIGGRVPFLIHHPLLSGIPYGIAVYFVMNYVVIPLSAAGRGPFSPPVFINGILIHAFGVGLPIAIFARSAAL